MVASAHLRRGRCERAGATGSCKWPQDSRGPARDDLRACLRDAGPRRFLATSRGTAPGALGFEDPDVTIAIDADRAGPLTAQRIQRDLTDIARTVTIADLAPDRQDG